MIGGVAEKDDMNVAKRLQDIEVFDPDGKSVRLGDLWSEQPGGGRAKDLPARQLERLIGSLGEFMAKPMRGAG